MDENMDKDYDKGVDAIYLNESEDKFQHQKDHYKNQKVADSSDHIKASYDDIQEANTADRIKDFTTKNASDEYACKAPNKSDYAEINNLKKTTSNKIEDYKEVYGSPSCKSGVKSNTLNMNEINDSYSSDNKDNFKAASSNQLNKDYSKNNNQSDISSSIETPDSIGEEYFVVITDNYVDDDNYTYDCGCGNVSANDSSIQQKDNQSNKYEEQSNRNYSESSQGLYSGSNQSEYINNIQNPSSQNVKDNTCNSDLKQDILDEADRVMGDDVL